MPGYVTRLNPSTSGGLHLGHIYTALVNQDAAHSTGGKFIVRVADDHANTTRKAHAGRNLLMAEQMAYDLDWLGLDFDAWHLETEMRKQFTDVASLCMAGLFRDEVQHTENMLSPLMMGRPDIENYPYTPYMTGEKVWLDYMEGVNLLARGVDLTSEFSLYCYYCQLWDLPRPEFWIIPRLRSGTDISKHSGGYRIAEYRANGWTPAEVLALLRKACLYNDRYGFRPDNLRPDPCL